MVCEAAGHLSVRFSSPEMSHPPVVSPARGLPFIVAFTIAVSAVVLHASAMLYDHGQAYAFRSCVVLALFVALARMGSGDFWGARGGRGLAAAGARIAVAALVLHIFGEKVGAGAIGPARAVYLAGVIEGAMQLFRRLAARDEQSRGPATEFLRLGLVAMAALWIASPVVTWRFLGGADAKWYAVMAKDFIEQARAGVFPVLVGQTEYGFNGGVHPIRSAPLHLWWCGIIDLLTGRSLEVLPIRHLTVVISSLGASVGLYVGLTALSRQDRWSAMAVAILYTCAPAQLAAIYTADAYMTFMAFPWVTAALVGAALAMKDAGNPAAWWWLTIGLGLAWIAHPSVGGNATWVCAGLFAANRLIRGTDGAVWQRLSLSLVVLALALAFYFVGMAEIRGGDGAQPLKLIAYLIGVSALFLAFVEWEEDRVLSGAVAAVVGVLGLGVSVRILGSFAALAVGLYGAIRLGGRLVPRLSLGGLERVTGAAVAAGFLTPWILGVDFAGKGPTADFSLGIARELVPALFKPAPAEAIGAGHMQAGWPIHLLLVLAGFGAWHSRSPGPRIFFVVGLIYGLLLLAPKGLGDLFWGTLPDQILQIVSLAFDRRMLPVLVPLFAVAGFLGGVVLGGRARQAMVFLLLLLLPWSLWDAAKYVRRGFATWLGEPASRAALLPEVTILTKYAYDLLKIPPYVSHSLMDYRVESRLLNDDLSVRIGPRELMAASEATTARRTELVLDARLQAPGSPWLLFDQELELAPRSRELLRFEFAPDLPAGFLMFQGRPALYQEYQLPSTGFGQSFGFGPTDHPIMTQTNSGEKPVRYHFEFLRLGAFAPDQGTGTFARIVRVPFDDTSWPVRVTSLLPYTAEVRMEAAGYLETFRCYIPGYRAWINGQPTAVQRSPRHLVMVPVVEGTHTVVVRYVGTRLFRVAHAVSATTWLLLAVAGAVLLLRKRSDVASTGR